MTRHVVRMSLEEADHYSPEQKAAIRASMPAHEREAREKGIPILGSGAVYPIAEELISCDPFPIPGHWWQIGGIDIGWDHPTAAVRLVIDRDTDEKFITNTYREPKRTPLEHVAHLKAWGSGNMPWAWPADALSSGKDGGEPIKNQYEEHGLNMLSEHATLPEGSMSVEAGVMRFLEELKSGKLKIFNTCRDWFEEFGLYHRKKGKIVDELDDLMDASRYAFVMERHAEQIGAVKAPPIKPRKRL